MKLTGSQVRQVQDTLADAFDPGSLRMMVRTRLDADLDDIAGEANMRRAVFDLIEWAEKQGRTRELIAAVREELPGNAQVQALCQLLEDAPAADAEPADFGAPSAEEVLRFAPTLPLVADAQAAALPVAGAVAVEPSRFRRYEPAVRGVTGMFFSFWLLALLIELVLPGAVTAETQAASLAIVALFLTSVALGWFFYSRRAWRAVWITAGLAFVVLLITSALYPA